MINDDAAALAREIAEQEAERAAEKAQAEREAIIAAEQDAALQAVRDRCDAERAALKDAG